MMRVLFAVFLGAFFLGSAGCVERMLQIRSDPSGASVYVNGKPAGTTPLEHSFDYYGTFEVALRAKGESADELRGFVRGMLERGKGPLPSRPAPLAPGDSRSRHRTHTPQCPATRHVQSAALRS